MNMGAKVQATQDIKLEMVSIFLGENPKVIMAKGDTGTVVQIGNEWPLVEIDRTGSRYYLPTKYLMEIAHVEESGS